MLLKFTNRPRFQNNLKHFKVMFRNKIRSQKKRAPLQSTPLIAN